MMLLLLACVTEPPAPWDLAATDQTRTLYVRDGRIAKIGAATPVEPATVTLHGDLITAGFVDAHGHPLGLGKKQSEIDLVGAPTYRETLDRIRSGTPPTGWVLGRGWDQNDWRDPPEGGWPLAADLDAVTGDRPAALRRIDGHAVWVNSAALDRAGIVRDTPDPAGGRIVRDGTGRPTGVLIDTAMSLVATPEPGFEDRLRWLRLAQQEMLSEGLIGVHAMGMSDDTLRAWQTLAAAGELTGKAWLYVSPDTKAAERLLDTGPWSENGLHIVGIKAFADGALGSRGALLHAPYTDAPHTNGLPIASEEDLRSLAERCLATGTQLAVHAIGDKGVTHVLDAFEAARAAHPDAHLPLRLEHAQVVRPEDVARMAALNVIASMQPVHATSDAPWAEARLGEERIRWAYRWRSLRDAGVTLAFGSDFPVEQVEPGLGVWAAVARRPRGDEHPWYPDEALPLEQAIAGFTSGAAAAVQAQTGTLDVGRPADLTVWSVADEQGLPWLDATATIVDGELRWRRETD